MSRVVPTAAVLADQLARLVRATQRAHEIHALGYVLGRHRALTVASLSDVVLEGRELAQLVEHFELPGATAALGGPGSVAGAVLAGQQRWAEVQVAGSEDLGDRVDRPRDGVGDEAGEGDGDAPAEEEPAVGVGAGEADGRPAWLVGLRGALDVLEALSGVELEQLTGVVHLDHDTSSAVGSSGAGTPGVSVRTVGAATDSSGASAARAAAGGRFRSRREAFSGAIHPTDERLDRLREAIAAAASLHVSPGTAQASAGYALRLLDELIYGPSRGTTAGPPGEPAT